MLNRILYAPYKVLIFAPFLVLSTFIIGTLCVITATLFGPKIAGRIYPPLWARLLIAVTPSKVDVKGLQRIQPDQSYVIVANHLSLYDILVVYATLGVDLRWVMKQELRKVPIIGIASEKLGHVYIDRSNSDAAVKALEDARAKVANGTCIIFFPEGTRSRNGEMGKFKKGAFKMALDLGLPILPITINGTRSILPSDSVELYPGRAELIVHPPVATANLSEEDLHLLIAETRETILQAREPKELPAELEGYHYN